MLILSLSLFSFPVSTRLVFKVLWFVSLQTLMSSRGKISAGITSKHQHHPPFSCRSLLPPALLLSTRLLFLLHLTSLLHFMACFPVSWFSFLSFLFYISSLQLPSVAFLWLTAPLPSSDPSPGQFLPSDFPISFSFPLSFVKLFFLFPFTS